MADLDRLVEELSGLTIMEAAQLKSRLEEAWGVTAAAPMMMGAMPMMGAMAGGDGGAAAVVEEAPTEFNVIMTDFGPKKIDVIKVVRQLTDLGLKEAKDLVEAAPNRATIMEAVTKEAADDAKGKLEAVSAVIEVVPA